MSDTIKIDEVNYVKDIDSKSNQGFIGFFDWLRTNQSTIVGIRLCFFEHQSYNNYLLKLPYTAPSFENKCVEILFNEGTYNPGLSGDQDFTDNYAFKSAGGNYLFTFGLDHLNDEELSSILKYCTIINEMDLIPNNI